MSAGRKQPVRRGDGMEYPSVSEAARQIVAEQGVGNPAVVGQNIMHVLRGDTRTAYGWRWERVCDDDDERDGGVSRRVGRERRRDQAGEQREDRGEEA